VTAVDRTASVCLGLLAVWIVHDLEEVAAMPWWMRTRLPSLRERYPSVPDAVWRRLSVDGGEFALAVGVMGGLVTAVSVDGLRTGGRSAAFQAALTGFGLHGVVHLAQAAVARGYTPGSVTSALVVVPYTVWARRRLRASGVLRPTRARDAALGLALAPQRPSERTWSHERSFGGGIDSGQSAFGAPGSWWRSAVDALADRRLRAG
jgi:hypothetical protein